MPACGAVMTCSIFIASTTATCWPCRTASPSATLIATMVPWIGEATPTDPSGPVRSGASIIGLRLRRSLRLHRGVVGEQRQRVLALDAGAGEARAALRAICAAGTKRCRCSAGAASVGDMLIEPAGVNACRPRNPDAPARCAGTAMLVLTPSRRNSLSARVGPRHGIGEIRRRRMDDHLRQQRIERARWCDSRRSRSRRCARRDRSAPRRP